MYIDFCVKVYESLNNLLTDARVIIAYPDTFKPNRIERPIVCIAPHDVQINPVGISAYGKEVDAKVSITIFAPTKLGISRIKQIVDAITDSEIVRESTSLAIEQIEVNNSYGTISTQIIVSYKAYIGDSDE